MSQTQSHRRTVGDAALSPIAFIGIARVKQISGLSRSTIHRRIARKEFPQPVIAEGTCTRWDLGEVMAWRAAQFEKRAKRIEQSQGQTEHERS